MKKWKQKEKSVCDSTYFQWFIEIENLNYDLPFPQIFKSFLNSTKLKYIIKKWRHVERLTDSGEINNCFYIRKVSSS